MVVITATNHPELEDFLSDFARRYVLVLPAADGKKITTQILRQWEKRVRPHDHE